MTNLTANSPLIDSADIPQAEPCVGKVISLNVPLWFSCPSFLAWLNSPESFVFSWHRKGEDANDYSDVVVGVEPNLEGEGTNSDMPALFWDLIIEAARNKLGVNASNMHYFVRLTNLQDDTVSKDGIAALEARAKAYQVQVEQEDSES